jgi:hypothetical protein
MAPSIWMTSSSEEKLNVLSKSFTWLAASFKKAVGHSPSRHSRESSQCHNGDFRALNASD